MYKSVQLAPALAVVLLAGRAKSKSCNNGEYSCTPPKECCTFKLGCCNPHSPQHVFFWNHWYFWCSIFFVVVVFCVCGCGMWRKGRVRRPSDTRSTVPRVSSYSSWCQPPQYSRCSSFLLPPPYSEVTAKPELYPLVLSYNIDGTNKTSNGTTGGAGRYYVVQQFRNYFMNPLSTFSSGATNVDAINTNLLNNSVTQIDPNPPPYSPNPDIVQQQIESSVNVNGDDNCTLEITSVPEPEQSITEQQLIQEQSIQEEPVETEIEDDNTTETAPLNPVSQLFAHFNTSISKFSKHKRYSSIILPLKQSTKPTNQTSRSAPPTPSTINFPKLPSMKSNTELNYAPISPPPANL